MYLIQNPACKGKNPGGGVNDATPNRMLCSRNRGGVHLGCKCVESFYSSWQGLSTLKNETGATDYRVR